MLSLFHTFYFQLCLVPLSLFHTLVDLNCDVVTISHLLFSAMSGVPVPVSHPGRSEL